MTRRDEFQQLAKKIESLVTKLEESADPALRSSARDLVQSLMELHGAGIERMLELAHDSGESGAALIERLGNDELVRNLLLLYGLHPQDLRTRVQVGLEKCAAFLKSQGASAELVSVDEQGAVIVHLRTPSTGCGSTTASLKARVEATLMDAAPDAGSIVVQDVSASALAGPTFISVEKLWSQGMRSPVTSAQVNQNGD